ncbi:MAG: hypothetical protein Q9209_002059 [Squamulea sp. 1 TL-2023]
MSSNIMKLVVTILQSPNPIKVHDPDTFWTFIIDGVFAVASISDTTLPKFVAAHMCLDMAAIHMADQTFRALWGAGLDARFAVYRTWAFALRKRGEGDVGTAMETLTELFDGSVNGLEASELDVELERIQNAVGMGPEKFVMPRNPYWLARLSAEEMEKLHWPWMVASMPG